MKAASLCFLCLIFLISVLFPVIPAARADGGAADVDPISRLLYPPEALMGHAQELGLDEAQRTAIRAQVGQAQKLFIDAQLSLQEVSEGLQALLQERPVDESKVLAAADRVMDQERTIKRAHLALLIRLKNLLTPDQLAKMAAIRQRSAS